jgi:hypothetical protein
MASSVEVSGVESGEVEASENIEDLNSRTASFSAEMIDTTRRLSYQLPGLELVGNGKRKTVAGNLIVHR